MNGGVETAPPRARQRPAGQRTLIVIGTVLLGVAVLMLGFELLLAWQTGSYRLLATGELWFRLDAGSLNLIQAVVQRYIHPVLWDPLLVSLLQWPAWPWLGGLGAALLALAVWRGRA